MLSQDKKLPYGEFYTRGYQVFKNPYFTLKVRENKNGKTRLGVVIGKAAEKTAVKRNFWKRQAKSFFSSNITRPGDFVIIFTPKAKEITRKRFKIELLALIKNFS